MSHTTAALEGTVPFLDLKAQHELLSDEILAAWKEILANAAFIGGKEVSEFEREFADFVGCAHAVGVGSGTDALRLALLAMDLNEGDEVITSPHTFIATTEAITQAGARPVFVDVDPVTGNLDPLLVERAVTSRTRVLCPVHLYGQTADMEPLMEIANRRGISVLEDAAQAHGAQYGGRNAGSIGRAGAFSFYPGKNLGACGEAGAITTNDAELAARVRMLRDHGQPEKYKHTVEGYNARLDGLQAAALRIKLRCLDSWNESRRARAARYREALEALEIQSPVEVEGRRHVYHLFVVRHAQRDRLRDLMQESGIATGLHYPIALHLQPAYAHLGLSAGRFPEAERWAQTCLSLPMFPDMTDEQVERVCDRLRQALEQL